MRFFLACDRCGESNALAASDAVFPIYRPLLRTASGAGRHRAAWTGRNCRLRVGMYRPQPGAGIDRWHPFADQSIIGVAAGPGIPLPEVKILATEGQHGLAGGLVMALQGDTSGSDFARHDSLLLLLNPVDYRVSWRKQAALPTVDRYPKFRIRRDLRQVVATGDGHFLTT